MSVSVIMPAYNEEKWLNRTIKNIYDTAAGDIEVIVFLNGYTQGVYDATTVVLASQNNLGERIAMNAMVKRARGSHILRIDAHCDFSPKGWDEMMEMVTGSKDMTQAVLTAVDKEWNRIPGHRYERCRLLPNMEAKWEKPNVNAPSSIGGSYNTKMERSFVIPNMSSTGCGFMMRKDFYNEIGGADESYPLMGAIGEEFSVKTWLNGGKVQTRTDVIIGHIFETGAYNTGGVLEARRRLVEEFGDRYDEIYEKFPDLDWEANLRPTAIQSNVKRDSVTIWRTDEKTFKDDGGRVVGKKVKVFVYLWVAEDHKSEIGWSDEQLEAKYTPIAKLPFCEQTFIVNAQGEMIQQSDEDLIATPIPPEHYEISDSEPETQVPL